MVRTYGWGIFDGIVITLVVGHLGTGLWQHNGATIVASAVIAGLWGWFAIVGGRF